MKSTPFSPLPQLPNNSPKVLDLDIETRLVGFYSAGRWNPAGCEPTAIACGWLDESKVNVWLQNEMSVPDLIENFRPYYDEADMVIGHYITKFDLPILNGMCLEFGLPMLTDKLTHDTKVHLKAKAGISASQENLSDMLGLPEGKYHMSDVKWRASTRLTDEGIERTRRRVMDDVKQHKALYKELLQRQALRPPRTWKV